MRQPVSRSTIHHSPLAPHPVEHAHQPLRWLEHEARLLIGNLREGTISPVAYDTAWVAQVSHPTQPSQPLFPQAISWLIAHQHADGSWGAESPYVPDRILSTLAALCALTRRGQRVADVHATERGIGALWRLFSVLPSGSSELVGFELLLPALVEQCSGLGIPLPSCAFAYMAGAQAKLAAIPEALRYSPELSLSMSIEFMGESADVTALRHVQSSNGSLGNSPAATAYFLTLRHDVRAQGYLKAVQDEYGDGMPFAHPLDLFEPLWVLDHLRRGGVPIETFVPAAFWEWLAEEVASSGISFSRSFAAPDSDDTAVAISLLTHAGYPVDAQVLNQFARDGVYVSYAFERNPSTSANIHVLEALLALDTPDAQLSPIVEFLASMRSEGMFWHDKWHLSPYYSTCHALAALCALPDTFQKQRTALVAPILQWLMYTQRPDGAWGWLQGTVEETAYALLALLEAQRRGWSIADEVIVRGALYLEQYASIRNYYPLWIGKCLYAPIHIIHAAVIAARYALAQRASIQIARTIGGPSTKVKQLFAHPTLLE